jgi:hypothetical protein
LVVTTTTEARAAVDRASALVQQGRWDDAVALLADVNRNQRDPWLAREILRIRNISFDSSPDSGRDAWPPVYEDLFDDLPPGDVPEIERSALTSETLGAGLLHHGSLLVRGLVDAAIAEALVQDIDASLEAARAWLAGASPDETSPWFELFTPAPPY